MELTDSNQFNVELSEYKGPLDVLLELAKSQKVDLEKISVTSLADQVHEVIANAKEINLEVKSGSAVLLHSACIHEGYPIKKKV